MFINIIDLRFFICFSFILFIIFFVRPKRFDPILEEDLRNVSVQIQKSEFDLEVEKWKDCMKMNMEMGNESWYFTRFGVQSCMNETNFFNVPVQKTGDFIFINITTNPYTVISIGNSSESQKKLAKALHKDSIFYGTHLKLSNIFSEYQKLENYLNGSEGNSTEIMNLETYLKAEKLEGKLVDLIHINVPVSNYEIFNEISTGLDVCQYSIILDYPTASNKEKMIRIISKIISNPKFIILVFHDLQLFLVNYEDLECRKKYLSYIF